MAGLGRGLDALIDTSHVKNAGGSSISEIAIDKIVVNPEQPRKNFDEESLQELAESIREHGVVTPITLRKNEDDTYLIIAGERRYRASKMVGLRAIPAYVREAKDEQIVELALIENIQREDLDAIEIALAYQKLMDEYKLTQERVSEKVGKKRATVANYLRLLKLPAEVQLAIRDRKIDMGHARALLALNSTEKQLQVYKHILTDGLSVRQVEELTDKINKEEPDNERKNKQPRVNSSLYPQQQEHLAERLQTKVQIKKDRLIIYFSDEENLNTLLDRIS